MEQRLAISEKTMHVALHQFIFPFSINRTSQNRFKEQLLKDEFNPFLIYETQQEERYYGPGYQVSHREMERYYLPFTSKFLFPHAEGNEEGFRRYSKQMNLECSLHSPYYNLAFTIHSLDVILCPFDLGFITIRTELNCAELSYSLALEFAKRFRVLQNMNKQDDESYIQNNKMTFKESESFIFHILGPNTLAFLEKGRQNEAHFEKLPFFLDECMYVACFYSFVESSEISLVDIYRAARIDGLDKEGKPFIGATNLNYIKSYSERHSYDRWGPDTYFITDENAFSCITKQSHPIAVKIANKMYGEYYYGLLLNLFHKIVLLKISNQYSQVRLEQNQGKIEELIRSITDFSAKYYFIEVVSQSQGKEIFLQLRKFYGNDELFVEVKRTLTDLFEYQSNYTNKRASYMLRILTIYTVISGIYGMNQVIEDLKGPINWTKMKDYSVFQYFAFVVAVSGILIGISLAIDSLRQLIKKRKY
ncbi:hypothetical protein GQF01_03845 [Paenibacillus sp. 5J-6]|uniref:Group-specific protein n=1 Tax=Paenibacillus silvestris TaxID=2606219 RepID=A0A6L8UT07_9BACL|nr:hypothetical protein [Paenibacillus silvestris]MZQ81255.1 hypothetical protein [Paenibacillus silvestris]